ncbi:MAG: hypothetical protein IH623_03565 [Verrucomicrobia bacterium]|nr:hypothetical protein [Verrucomicrobiota bacterium]
MKIALTKITLLALALSLNLGCQTTVYRIDEAALFRKKNPVEAKHYQSLIPVSPELLKDAGVMYQQIMQGFLSGVERRKDDPEALTKFIERHRKILSKMGNPFYDDDDGRIAEILSEGGTLYAFDYKRPLAGMFPGDDKGTYGDSGRLVLRHGRIIYRDPPISND